MTLQAQSVDAYYRWTHAFEHMVGALPGHWLGALLTFGAMAAVPTFFIHCAIKVSNLPEEEREEFLQDMNERPPGVW